MTGAQTRLLGVRWCPMRRVGIGGRALRRSVAIGCGSLLLLAAGAAPGAAAPTLDAHASVRQIYLSGLAPHASISLLRGGRVIATRRANPLGGLLFRHLKPGAGYRVRRGGGGTRSGPLTVLSKRSAPPSTDVYDQQIAPNGYGYLTTRDGTKLAIYVHPPQDVTTVLPVDLPPVADQAPWPTLIEYSGYGYADPAGPQSGISILANLMGFTVVDVNMRGTGCSGGAFNFFEPLQSLDGYDIVETISRQPWVDGGKVGMMGISYGGISQLFTAATQPPHLAAISPLSVIDATQTTLYPGGILNTGFALEWAKERIHDAEPATAEGGQSWAYQRIGEGDQTCEANQAMHGEAVNLLRKIRHNNHYRPHIADPLSPLTFVDKINVPTFMACQWTDEQTGGHCPTLAENFSGTDRRWFTFTNGTHVDSLDPETFNRWFDFLELYVAHRAPATFSPFVQGAAPVIYEEAMGIQGVTMPPDPIQQEPTYDSALAAFEQLKPIRILFDSGAGGSAPGQPYPGFEQSFDRFPIPQTAARSWFFTPNGKLLDHRRKKAKGRSNFRWDPGARSPTDFSGDTAAGAGGLWTATPPYHWEQHPKGTALSYLSAPLKDDTVVIGAGSVRAWVRSSRPNVDLQASITEVRPDGKETFVQGGWVRGNERKLDRAKSSRLEPVLGLRESDVARLPARRFVRVTIPLYYEGHAYRAGSRIRVTISAPNGDQPIWAFAKTRPKRPGLVTIAATKRKRSKLTLPVIAGVNVPTPLPPCPGLRGEPCRDYRPIKNR